uniref:Putative translation elongation factor n=1 Tax=Clostridioides difficile TaxID=1496 RepID=A0A381KNU6_CLODI|nr:putative translation elongation factor [Clostridioides difficile]
MIVKCLRNVAVLGHSGCGKTNLIETIAYTANTNKIPKLTDKVNMTYSMGLIPIEYNDYKFNLLDTQDILTLAETLCHLLEQVMQQ